jgi:hypothetical protein
LQIFRARVGRSSSESALAAALTVTHGHILKGGRLLINALSAPNSTSPAIPSKTSALALAITTFHGDRIFSWQDAHTARIYIIPRHICQGLGIAWQGQILRLGKDPLFQPHILRQVILTEMGTREVIGLDLDYLPTWLNHISVEKVKPEAREKLLAYQQECADVLREYWQGSGHVINPRHQDAERWIEIHGQAARMLTVDWEVDRQFKIPEHRSRAETVKRIRNIIGLDLSDRLAISPLMEDIAEGDAFLEITPLSTRFELPRGLLNIWLAHEGLQVKEADGTYTMTPRSQSAGLAQRHAWQMGSKSGYNLKWRVTFIEQHLEDIRRFGELLR